MKNNVIAELDKITSLTKEKEKINRMVSKNFSEAEQKEIVILFEDLLLDELLHVMAIMRAEREKAEMIRGVKGDDL